MTKENNNLVPSKTPNRERTVFTPIELLVLTEVGRYQGMSNDGHFYRIRELAEEAKLQPIKNLIQAGLLEAEAPPTGEFSKHTLTSKGLELYNSLTCCYLGERFDKREGIGKTKTESCMEIAGYYAQKVKEIQDRVIDVARQGFPASLASIPLVEEGARYLKQEKKYRRLSTSPIRLIFHKASSLDRLARELTR